MTLQKPLKPGIDVAWVLSLGQALFVTALALYVAVEAGHRLGGSHDGQRLLAGGAIVAVLNAHLLMAISRRASVGLRLWAIGILIVSAGIAVYVHASVFLSVQSQAGELRMADVDSSDVSAAGHTRAPRRVASMIMMELAGVKAEQVRLQSKRCADDCSRIDARDAFLTARIAALDAEVDEARRWQRDQDRLEFRKAAAKDDPVTVRVADLLGVNSGATALVVGLLFAVMLEGTGSLCWFMVLQRRDSMAAASARTEVTSPVPAVPSVTVTAESVTARSPIVMPPVTPDDPASAEAGEDHGEQSTTSGCDAGSKWGKVLLLAERVRPEIEAGRVRPTVTEIREHLACARSTAAEVRRALNAR